MSNAVRDGFSTNSLISASLLSQYSAISGMLSSQTIFAPARKPSRMRTSFFAPRFWAV